MSGDASKRKQRRHSLWKMYQTLFGDVVVHCHEIVDSSIEVLTAPSSRDKNRTIEIGFTFIPRNGSPKELFMHLPPQKSSNESSICSFNLNFRPMVDSKSDVFQACRHGDISTMQSPFSRKQVPLYGV